MACRVVVDEVKTVVTTYVVEIEGDDVDKAMLEADEACENGEILSYEVIEESEPHVISVEFENVRAEEKDEQEN